MKLGKHVCPVCRNSFKRPVNLKNQVSKFHAGQGQGLAENSNSKQQACMVSTCSLKFRTVDKLIEHVINVHRQTLTLNTLHLINLVYFQNFENVRRLFQILDLSRNLNIRWIKKEKKTTPMFVTEMVKPQTTWLNALKQNQLENAEKVTVKSMVYVLHECQFARDQMGKFR